MEEKRPVKIYVDDMRPVPEGFILAKSALEAKELINHYAPDIEYLDLDYDLGPFTETGLDLLKWLHENNMHYPVGVHSTHPWGRPDMEDYIEEYWWNHKRG